MRLDRISLFMYNLIPNDSLFAIFLVYFLM